MTIPFFFLGAFVSGFWAVSEKRVDSMWGDCRAPLARPWLPAQLSWGMNAQEPSQLEAPSGLRISQREEQAVDWPRKDF